MTDERGTRSQFDVIAPEEMSSVDRDAAAEDARDIAAAEEDDVVAAEEMEYRQY